MSAGPAMDAILRRVPAPARIVQWAARSRPVLRSRLSMRLFAALTRRTVVPDLMETNLGICASLSCEIPSASPQALFGKPSLYDGEHGALLLAAQLCRQADAFVDIGAHLGYFSFFVRHRCGPGLPIHYFEPDPRLFALLQSNVARNRLPAMTGHSEAVGAATGESRFYRNLSDPLSGSLEPMFIGSHAVEAIRMPVRTFADFAQEAGLRRACVKVDVEGAEQQFVDGAAGAFECIDSLIIAVLGPAVEKGFVQQVIRQTGFNAFYINDRRLEQSRAGEFSYRPPYYNWLFCRLPPEELSKRLAGSGLEVA